jgi:hypothetical protein
VGDVGVDDFSYTANCARIGKDRGEEVLNKQRDEKVRCKRETRNATEILQLAEIWRGMLRPYKEACIGDGGWMSRLVLLGQCVR